MTDVAAPRAMQDCVECGVSDTEPRDHRYDPASGGITSRHFTCCAATGCVTCATILSDTSDNS